MRLWIVAIVAIVVVSVGGAVVGAKEATFTGKGDEKSPTKPEIRMIPKMTVAYVRHVGPYEECGAAWKKLMAWAGKNGLFAKNTVYLGMYHDNPENVPSEKLRSDVCISVSKETKAEGEVKTKEIGGQEYAVFLHRGPYEKLKTTYQHIYKEWAPTSKRPIAYDPVLEIYKNDYRTTPPEELLTEICVPLKNEPKGLCQDRTLQCVSVTLRFARKTLTTFMPIDVRVSESNIHGARSGGFCS